MCPIYISVIHQQWCGWYLSKPRNVLWIVARLGWESWLR